MAAEYVMQRDVEALRAEMRGEFAQVRGEFGLVRGELAAMEGRLRQELGAHTRTIVFANLGGMIGFGGLVLAAVALS